MSRHPPPILASREAQSFLASSPYPKRPAYPPLEDKDAWRRYNAEQEKRLEPVLLARSGKEIDNATTTRIAGIPVHCVTPAGWPKDDRRVLLHMHGGALHLLSGIGAKVLALGQSAMSGLPVVSVDYGMPPDAPYPIGLDQCVSVYRALLSDRQPEEIILAGESAGGNLSAATVLKARDQGLPVPAGLVLLSPEVDLTERGDTFSTLLGVDPALTTLMTPNLLYAAGVALDDPHVSPLFGDFKKGFPRTFIQSGTRDLFLSNAVNMHRALRRAGIEAHLHIWEGMPHGGFGGGTPEDRELAIEMRLFIDGCCRRVPR